MPDEPLSTAGGGLLGTNHLQESVDSLKSTIDRLNQGLSPLVTQLHQANRMTRAGGMGSGAGGMGSGAGAYPSMGWWGNNGGQGSAGGQQPRGTNGGGATFGGKSAGGGSGGAGGAGGTGGSGGSGAGEDDDQKKRGLGGRVLKTAGGKAGVAVAAGYAINAGLNSMIQKAGPGMYTADLIASQLSLGGATSRDAVLESMKGQVSGQSMADVAQGRYTLSRGLGVQAGSNADTRAQGAMGIAGIINPGIGNAQVADTMVALNSPDTSVKLRGIGIDTGRGPGSNQDPLTLANQILQKIGNWQSINTSDKINFHLDDPNGAIETTLRNWEAHGYLPPGTRDVIKEEIRAILIARMHGTNFADLQKLGTDANSSDRKVRNKALNQLRDAGVNPESITAEQRKKSTASRDRDLGMTDSFAAGARNATEALTAFTDVINKVLNGPLGAAAGYVGGVKGTGILGGGGGSISDIGAMGNGTGGQPTETQTNSSRGVPLTSSSNASGSNSASGAPGTQSGSAKATAGKKTIKFARPVAGAIGSGFGTRKDPITGRGRMHTGLDFRASAGTPIHASAAGTVVFSGSRGANYWAGNHVIIDHGGGYQTLYAHQSRVKARVGARVQQGEVIGYVGSTGRSTGAHLHFEIHVNGHPVDPAPYLGGAGVAISESTVSPSTQGTATAGSDSGAQSMVAGAGASGSAASGIITSERAALAAFSGAAGPSMGAGAAPADTTANTSSSSSNNASSGTSGTKTPTAPSSVTGNKAIVKQMAAAKGWTGKQWDALYQLVMHESGFKNTAQNPTSTAFGLFQFLNGTWSGYGVKKTSDPRGQTQAGLAYIAQRYGNPANAWAKWNSRSPHWYEDGVWRVDGDQPAVVHNDEMIIKAREARQIREVLLNGSAYGATSKVGQQKTGGGLQITIEQGAITVTTSAGVTPAGVNDLGKAIADQLAQNDKIQKLQEGVLT